MLYEKKFTTEKMDNKNELDFWENELSFEIEVGEEAYCNTEGDLTQAIITAILKYKELNQ